MALLQPPSPKKMSAPRFCCSFIACRSPRANRSTGASAKISVNSNSAMARANMEKSMGRRRQRTERARRRVAGMPEFR
jgi:hypothetical protein